HPDQNRLYVVYTPPNIHVQAPWGDSIHDFLGYHSSFYFPFLGTINYAVVVHQTGNAALQGYDAFQQFTKVSSHELAEAVTDPNVGGGWWDSQGNEIGDLCNSFADIVAFNGYTVQKEWSNQQFVATGNGHFLLRPEDMPSFTLLNNGIALELDRWGGL